MQKCPHGMYAEIKYDGERVQVHKQGDKFDYFSRSLKAVQPHKVCMCVYVCLGTCGMCLHTVLMGWDEMGKVWSMH